MDTNVIDLDEKIAKARETQTVGRGEVIDLLLDLRLEGVNADAVDALLKTVPGKTLVESAWLIEALEGLRHSAN